MEQAAERRFLERLQITQEVFDQKTEKSLGFTADLNAYGMMLISKTPFTVGETLRVSLDIPTGKKGNIRTSLTAECRWSDPFRDTELHNSGFRFVYPTRYDIEYIETLFYDI